MAKLDRYLHDILRQDAFDHFTAVEVRNAYMKAFAPGKAPSPSQLQRSIYRKLNHLVNEGLLTKKETSNPRRPTYSKTTEFHRGQFKVIDKLPKMSANVPEEPDHRLLLQLQDRAKQYQVDLIASIGESDEYKNLYDVYPVLKPQLESQYRLARERSSKLLGQLRAIERILAHYGSPAS